MPAPNPPSPDKMDRELAERKKSAKASSVPSRAAALIATPFMYPLAASASLDYAPYDKSLSGMKLLARALRNAHHVGKGSAKFMLGNALGSNELAAQGSEDMEAAWNVDKEK